MLTDHEIKESLLNLGYKDIEVCHDEEDDEYYFRARFNYIDNSGKFRTDGRHHLTSDKEKPHELIKQAREMINKDIESLIKSK